MPNGTSPPQPLIYTADIAGYAPTVMTVKDLFTTAIGGAKGPIPIPSDKYRVPNTVPLFHRGILTVGPNAKALETAGPLDPNQGQCALALWGAKAPSKFLLFYHVWSGITSSSVSFSIQEMGADAADVYAVLFWPKDPNTSSNSALQGITSCIDPRQVLCVSRFCYVSQDYSPSTSFQVCIDPDQSLGGLGVQSIYPKK